MCNVIFLHVFNIVSYFSYYEYLTFIMKTKIYPNDSECVNLQFSTNWHQIMHLLHV